MNGRIVVAIGGNNNKCITFAEDILLLARSMEALIKMLENLHSACGGYGTENK